MSQQVLFIQGGGEGAYAEDQALVNYLKQALGDRFDMFYPEFPGLERINYTSWHSQAIECLNALSRDAIVVAHSLGGAALLKLLSENKLSCQIKALYLLAIPYKCKGSDWGNDEFALDTDFAHDLPSIPNIVLYHCQNDEWIPFSHLAHYADKLPRATTVILEGQGHSFMQQDFIELVEDIQALDNL